MIHVDEKRAARRAAWISTVASLAGVSCLASPAWADQAADAAATGPGSGELTEVVVTANRRQENLQSVPIMVSAITGETATNMGITDTMTLANSVPGLNFQRQSNASIPFLRGVGSPVGQSGDEPSVALYVDDVYIPAGSASLFNLNAVDRMEVEKGPQGTLFGRNATGGVVQIFTRNPTATPTVDVNVGYANYDTIYYNGYASGALSNTLAANISGYAYNQHDGWGTNVASGNPAYTSWNNGGRVKFLWTPNDKFSALLTGDIDVTRTEVGIAYRPAAGTLAVPGLFPPPEGYYDVDERDSRSITKQEGVSLKLDGDLGWGRLISITAWRQTDAQQDFAYDSVPIPVAYVLIHNPEHTWTEELRLLSPDSSKLRWIVGLYYFNDRAAYDPLTFQGALVAPFDYINTYGYQKTESWSGFADGTYPITDNTNITAGFRYTSDKRDVEAGTFTTATDFVPASNSPGTTTWNKPTYRLVLSHNFTPDVMGYVGYNRGFKSGIYNLVILPFSPIGPPVQPETLDSYTIGAKTEFLDHKLRVNTEAFYYKDKNIQVDEVNGAATFITNAASATFKGIDLDITYRPIPSLTITASMEYLDGKYDSFPNGQYWVYQPVGGGNCAFTVVPGGPTPCGGLATPPGYNPTTGNWDLGGNKAIQSPPFSSYLSFAYHLPSPAGAWDFSVAWTHTGNYYADADNGQGQVSPSKPENDKQALLDLINASVTWTSPSGHWNAQVYGRNLTGQKYWSFALEDAFETQYSAAAPRVYGITLGLHW